MTDGLATGARRVLERYGEHIRATSVVSEFKKALLHTGEPLIDLLLRPTIGSRITLIGENHMGKTALGYKMMGAAQKTCRDCLTPIIEFLNDETGETKTTCMCGNNEPMSVVYFDLENEFDPAWAKTLGVDVGGTFNTDDKEASDFEETVEGLHVSPNARFAVCRVTSVEQASTLVESLFETSACDFLVLDSLAAMNPAETKKGRHQPGAVARAVSIMVKKLVSSQSQAWIDTGVAPTFVAMNQYRINIMAMPKTDNRVASGGKAYAYVNMQEWAIHTKYNDGITDRTQPHMYGDMTIKSRKDKQGGGTGSVAKMRLFVRPITKSHMDYLPGETNAQDLLYDLCKQMADVTKNPFWYEKRGSKITMLGREFTTVKGIREFLRRPDINYQLKLPIFAEMLDKKNRAHLDTAQFNYNPFDNEPIKQLIEGATDSVGAAAQRTLGERSYTGASAPKRAGAAGTRKSRAKAEGKENGGKESAPE